MRRSHVEDSSVTISYRLGIRYVAAASLVLLAANGSLSAAPPLERSLVSQYCLGCHNTQTKTADLALDALLDEDVAEHSETWEKVVRRLRARQMPPAGLPRPEESAYAEIVDSLSSALDQAAAASPDPGRTDTFRRLNRAEYRNAVRDLLSVEIDAVALLPADESSHGFDNVTVGDLSPTLLDRYINAAEKISRLAVGRPGRAPSGDTIRIPPDLTQESHIAGLPIGTRGGALIPYNFPVDGTYEIRVRLARDRNEQIEGLTEPHEIEFLLDRERLELFRVTPVESVGDHATADVHLRMRVPVKAGRREIGVAFLRQSASLIETARQPYQARFNYYRHPRIQPAVYSVTVLGPYDVSGPGDTESRKKIFTCDQPTEACAEQILTRLARRAYRRPVGRSDLKRPMDFFRQAQIEEGDFDAGIERALSAILVSPEFLFRIERDPADARPNEVYPVDDVTLASRLSFFLWSSIPDEPLLAAAEAGRLSEPAELEAQVRRMLADPRSKSLTSNFAAQWLYLRNLEAARPDMRLFPDFDDNLRQAMRTETELFFDSVLREDRPVTDLLDADYTFLNQRLAKHYGVPHIYGSHFRRAEFGDADQAARRGGLLRHASILTVTSYATRTSPVIRGHWILENILGIPPPPPPPNVPALEETKAAGKALTVRERLAVHRDKPACRGCHQLMDPVGFSLENYDAVGRWRSQEAGVPVDAAGGFPDGQEFDGVQGLERALTARPEIFSGVLTEKLLTYALGRGVETSDAPAVRQILSEAEQNDYRFSSVILGITRSEPFRKRRARGPS